MPNTDADEFIFVRCSSMHAEDENDDDSNIHTRASFAFENADDEDVVVANTAGLLESQGRKIFRTLMQSAKQNGSGSLVLGKSLLIRALAAGKLNHADSTSSSFPAAAVPNSSVILYLTDASKAKLFEEFCETRLAEENVRFVQDVLMFKRFFYDYGDSWKSQKSKMIYKAYMEPGASMEVNVPFAIRERVRVAVNPTFEEEGMHPHQMENVFTEAMEEVVHSLLSPLMVEFMETQSKEM